MNLRLEIPESRKLYECLKPEFEKRKEDRSTTRLSYDNGKLSVAITAKDAAALQASFNSVMKLVRVFEKVKENEF